MYATAFVDKGSFREGLFVPSAAIQEIGGQKAVFVRTSLDTFQVRPVQVKESADDRTEIAAGLSRDDAVVVSGAFTLKSHLLKGAIE
jgi:multidrug efflux pump subunit AcrA (membrane-fusion protein)